MPAQTELATQAQSHGIRRVYRGIDMLIAQGVVQFELWTSRSSCAASIMEHAVRAHYTKLTTTTPATATVVAK